MTVSRILHAWQESEVILKLGTLVFTDIADELRYRKTMFKNVYG